MTEMETLAERINDHLQGGGVVQVTTYLKSWLYRAKHVGWFGIGQDGNLYVVRGKHREYLSIAGRLSVGIRFGRQG